MSKNRIAGFSLLSWLRWRIGTSTYLDTYLCFAANLWRTRESSSGAPLGRGNLRGDCRLVRMALILTFAKPYVSKSRYGLRAAPTV
jgi:hypothetical protein